ncbi:hormonally up-regulated neu tumor-associated kinase [Phyllopteryx taeniolatus]|uniref:hormonally up-regulated neu tumor-associated kinase n=1 Tax=Phyllopteryx taeniolatus TaxID=161469 RepID=UPI002AD3BAF7|nr:hormonally up-regulated neu tumor-associated kinase [Phyllopteryx taeniolatus]XP_061609230.1 hormonally up-regulated neu tumor-associated kinase [Phyllopteryx taeniolatus]
MAGAAVKEKGGACPALLAAPCKDLLRSFPHSKRVGSYLVGKMINKGSFAKVMEGLHLATGEKVAIKVIDKKKARQDSYVQKNMKREPHIHQMLRHPNVVVLLETLETENSYYMVMELCGGGDLMERICDRKRLPEKEVRRYARQILSAVAHLHQRGVVHRDLKIENFLLDEHNNIKIVDFGLSNTLRSESLPPELLSTQCGSPAYAAPELLAHRKYGPKVDMWSVGVSVFAMLTGTLPFTVEPFNIKHLHHKMVDADIAHIPSDISKGAVTFVLSLLEADPDERPGARAAMEGPWINEGYAERPLRSLSRDNMASSRGQQKPSMPSAEDADASVLAYMTDTLGFSAAEVARTLARNRPSAVMATYHLLLAKIKRSRRCAESDRAMVKKVASRRAKASRQTAERRHDGTGAQQPSRRDDDDDDNGAPSSFLPPLRPSSPPEAPDEGAAASSYTTEALTLPDVLGTNGQVVHLSPPKTTASHLCDSAPCHAPSLANPMGDGGVSRPARQLIGSTRSDGGGRPPEAVLRFAVPQKCAASPRMHLETTQRAPPTTLPHLRGRGLNDGRGRKVSWVRLTPSGPSGLQVSGSKTPAFASQKHAVGTKSGKAAGTKRNSVTQLRSTPRRRMTELSLPLLPDRKLPSMEY